MDLMDTGIYIEEDRLFDFAASAARLARPEGLCGGRVLAAQLRRNYSQLRRVHSAVERRYGALPSPPAACEWLLDNWYMIQREYLSAGGELCAAGRLRRCKDGALVSLLCRSLVHSGGGKLTERRCLIFLDGFQSVCVLSRSELHIFSAALRAALIGAISEVCLQMQTAADTSPYAVSLEALFGSLRLISVLDMEKLINSADVTSAVLAADPSGDYPNMDNGTKQDYLRAVERLARRAGVEEHEYARTVIKEAKQGGRHVGFYLFDTEKKRGTGLYIAANILSTLFFSLLLSFVFESIAAALLLLIPVSELVKSLIDFLLLRILPPARLPRMDMRQGVPLRGGSICVISTLLDGSDPTPRLEELYCACLSEGKNLQFGLLADLPVASDADTPWDAALIETARQAVDALNRKYKGGFYLFTRRRRYDGHSWYGHERKRGALLELAKLLCGQQSQLMVTGDAAALKATRYIITLDSDTRMYPGAAGELIGAMLHPLNTPHIDEKRRVVTSGHAVIHPRIDTDLKSANATDFALIFAGAGGCDPYGSLCGELYMNAFGSGGFAGKGIIDAKALLICTGERFPCGRILSHDALEGAFLRGAYMGDAEFSDSFPARPLSYYRRLHRWVRGDWQNAPWIFAPGLGDIDRWRLLDTLRRSLVTPLTLAAIVLGFFLPGRGLSVAAWAALLALLSRLFISLAESGLSRRERVRLRRYTRLLTGAGGAIVQTFIRLWLLPFDAWVCLSAAATALWRMLVTHRDLLQWQTAAQSDGVGGGLAEHFRAMWFPVVLGLALLWLSPSVIGRSSGLIWLLSPLVCSALALPARAQQTLCEADRRYVSAAAEDAWRYLRSFSGASDNFLPPDNFQEQPPVGVAHRTSPTNMGLAMAAAVAACDMGAIERREAVGYIDGVVTAMERMERCMGHFFNWYDTRTLRPLSPAYISTVDSGNLYAGLLVVRSAAEDWGEALLSARVSRFMADMDFAPLFDRARGLFYICYDVSGQRGAGGWYDLLASEAMLTSYIAVAKGDVPKKHWRRLSRAQLQEDGFRGLASWTGTMFEYLMPELFLPLYHGSLLYESCKFCLYAQRRRLFSGKPWGVSESAFYSLDASLSYRYKAHGCAALALKRGQDADMVVSPYSSFLALAVEPRAAVQNLRRLESFGAVGRFGYIEALDFTPGRCRSSEGEQVRCYMAHHVAMSILAAANAVAGGAVRRRFMSDGCMSACSLLLQEKLPTDGVVIRRSMADVPEKAERTLSDRWRLRGGRDDRVERDCVLSNGGYSLTVSNSGVSSAFWGDTLIYERQNTFSLRVRCGGSEVSLPCAAPVSWELAEDLCRFRCVDGSLDCSVSISAAGGDCGELRVVELCGSGSAELLVSLMPVLASAPDYRSHRAFWSLGLCASLEGSSLLIRRLRRGDRGEQWLAFSCDTPLDFSAAPGGPLGYLTQSSLRARARVELKPGRACVLRFALCVAGTREDALAGADRILASGATLFGNMTGAAALHLGMSAAELGASMALLPAILENRLRGAAPRRDLWQYGISGDLPLICCSGSALECSAVLKSFCLLKSCGVGAELVYLTDEQGEYQRPLFRRVSGELAKVGLEALLSSPGGVHFAPLRSAALIESRSAVVVGKKPEKLPSLPSPVLSRPRGQGSVPEYRWEDGAFVFQVEGSLPRRIWQHILTNGSFGYIAADCGAGGMFYKNAREMPINLPSGDIYAVSGSEALWLSSGGRALSLFAASDALPCRVRYAPGIAVWEKRIGSAAVQTTAFIPLGCDARVLLIEGAAGMKISWRLETVLGAPDGSSARCSCDNGVFTCTNPEAYLDDVVFHACASAPAELSCAFAQSGMLMSVEPGGTLVLACGCCDVESLRRLCEPGQARRALAEVEKYWADLTGRLKIRSGVPALDDYINGWCAYQTIACRIMARTSLYQPGGAIGFRDQLQDAVNMLLLSPGLARQRIIDCCRHQYEEGDVMHWWHPHPDGDKGVRTRCSDDLLWLPWALCEYVASTGDRELCRLPVDFVSSPPLDAAQRDRYETPSLSQRSATVLDHARAAAECAMSRGLGAHGLPFFGSGDWNDALDNIDGESVWLGWFMSVCLSRLALLLDGLGAPDAGRFRDLGKKVGQAADSAWNGRYYLRGYHADGSPVGGNERIDLLPQSWSMFSPFAQPQRSSQAVELAVSTLTDREHRLVKLFSPPFTPDEPYPGYISGYGEGLRENGGQYTHGAIWLALAALKAGDSPRAWELLLMLLPQGHDMSRYAAEPFVLPADVSAAPGREGEAGWTWYTGSAGWFFRAVVTELLGLRLENGRLTIRSPHPPLPSGCSVDYTDADGRLRHIELKEGEITVDGEKLEAGSNII